MKKIVLVGNPNVGKSVLFSRLTGVEVIVSNYPGTTVEFTEGQLNFNNEQYEIIDLPGTYSLQPTAMAEEVTLKLLKEADIVINVVDATNLERNLYLTMELLETNYPMVIALNMSDDTKHRGIDINAAKLEELLKVPVIQTSGITELGIKKLKEELLKAKSARIQPRTSEERWFEIGKIIENVQHLSHRHHTFLEFLEDVSVSNWGGLLVAILVVMLGFKMVRFIGEGLINYFFDPLFDTAYRSFIDSLSAALGKGGLLHDILLGKLINGQFDFKQSMGLLTTAPYIELVMVLPYVLAFYILLSFLEDIGYIPRLALLLDSVMHRLGLHGFAIIPMLLGFGCNVPGILATRVLESERERFIASTLISIGVPCAALQAMIFGIVGKFGGQFVLLVYVVLFISWLLLGLGLNYFSKGYSQELLLEIPPYRFPNPRLFAKKVWFRIKGFILEAIPIVLASVFVINILHQIKLFEIISGLVGPLLSCIFGLPKEAIWVLVVGVLRKDIAAGMLIPLNLTLKQLIIASVVLSMSFPCVATLVIFFKELGVKRLIQAILIMAAITVFFGGTLNAVWR